MNRKTATLVAFFAAGIVLRLPFRSHFLYHWDSVNFALGLAKFDTLIDQPQPPGYVLYILLGRLFKLIFVEDNASLVWMSVLFSGLAAAMLYWLAASLFDHPVGVTAGLLGLTSPLMWFYSEVALSYIVEAFFVSAVAYCCYRQLQGDGRYLIPGAALLGLAGGFRQNTPILLLPLWLFALKGFGWRRRLAALGALAVVTAAWFATLVAMSGGLDRFLQAMIAQITCCVLPDSAAGSTQTRLMTLARFGLFNGLGTLLAGMALPVLLVWAVRRWRALVHDPAWQVLGLWVLPSLAFYALFILQSGYTFTYLPGIFALIAFTLVKIIAPYLARVGLGQRAGAALTGGLVAANVAFFLFAGPYLLGQEKYLLRAPSYPAIRQHDAALAQKLDFIRQRFPPEQTLVLAGGMDFRIPDYYLSDYRMSFLSHSPNQVTEQDIQQAGSIRYLVLLNDEPPYPEIDLGKFETYLDADPLYWVELGKSDMLLLSRQGVALRRTTAP